MSIAFFRLRNLYKNSYFIQPQTLHKFLFAPIRKKLNITYNGVFDKAALMIRLAMFFFCQLHPILCFIHFGAAVALLQKSLNKLFSGQSALHNVYCNISISFKR